MKLDLLVLDWSGTVSDDFKMVLDSVNNILAKFGKPLVTDKELRNDFRPDIATFYRDRGINDYDTIKQMHINYFRYVQEKPRPIPGAVDAVKELGKFVPIAILSAHPEEELLGDIWRYGLEKDIRHACGGANKAMLRDFEHIIMEMCVDKGNVLSVGDTVVDIGLAAMMGVSNIAVLNPGFGYQPREQLEAFRPQPTHGIIEHISELPRIIKNDFSKDYS